MEDSTSVEVLNAAKETLLQGLSEENQGLQSVPTISHSFYLFHPLSSIYIYINFFFFFKHYFFLGFMFATSGVTRSASPLRPWSEC